MVAALIREKISAAVQAEAESGQLSRRLEQELPKLSHKLVLPETEPVAGLLVVHGLQSHAGRNGCSR